MVNGYTEWFEAFVFTALEIEIHPFYDSENKAPAEERLHTVIDRGDGHTESV